MPQGNGRATSNETLYGAATAKPNRVRHHHAFHQARNPNNAQSLVHNGRPALKSVQSMP